MGRKLQSEVSIKKKPGKKYRAYFGSPGRTRTADRVVNSHLLYQLSYRGMHAQFIPALKKHRYKNG